MLSEVKEETVIDNGIGSIKYEEIKFKTEEATDYDFKCCCYCAEEFDTAQIRDRHEVQCQMGPQLIIRLSTAKLKDFPAISNTSQASLLKKYSL
nr:unnamed protein product [Callosobruchus analis]